MSAEGLDMACRDTKRLCRTGLLLLLPGLVIVMACRVSSTPAPETGPAVIRAAEAVTVDAGAVTAAPDGAALYARYCALCHGADGSGYAADNAPSLVSESFLSTASPGFIWWGMAYGRPGTPMSAWSREQGGPLGHPELNALLAYLRGLRSVTAVPVEEQRVVGNPEAGQRVYREQCASCHGEKGQGGQAVSLGNPVFLATASDGFIRYAIEHGRAGTRMPAFGGRLSARQLDDVTAFIRGQARTFQRPGPVAEPPPSFEQVVLNPQGPPPRFSPPREGRYVPVDELKAALDAGARMVLLDARPTSDWVKSHIPGALPVPFYDPKRMSESLPRDGTWIIAYCACPHAASGKVVDSLRAEGFTHTAVLDEGVLVWAGRGYPMTVGQPGDATGQAAHGK